MLETILKIILVLELVVFVWLFSYCITIKSLKPEIGENNEIYISDYLGQTNLYYAENNLHYTETESDEE